MDAPNWLYAFPLAGVILGFFLGWLTLSLIVRLRALTDEKDARNALENAHKEAEHVRKTAEIDARNAVVQAQEKYQEQVRSHRQEMSRAEERLSEREATLDRKLAMIDKKEDKLDNELLNIEHQKLALQARQAELAAEIAREQETIQGVAALSQEEARKLLLARLENEMHAETGALIRRSQEEARKTSDIEAQRVLALAIQRYAANQVCQITISSVSLPNEEMKGRVIGKEGRNIRAFEAATGTNLLVDDTPNVIMISSFDPVRREISRVALERLISDGRIQPASIEETVATVTAETEEIIRRAGEDAIYQLALNNVNPELVRMIGRLKFRYSFAQNVLMHSIEVAHMMGMMASELGLDAALAKRIGLLHDIGKAIDHTVEGSHAIIGADLLKKYGEAPVIVNAVAAHHEEVGPESVYAVLAIAGDAVSAARPGARSESTESYLKRLTKLEDIANSFRGVQKSYAIQAGREIRVVVDPAHIDDNEALQLARNISKRIEQELKYPGQIRITVIRETRCVEYAK